MRNDECYDVLVCGAGPVGLFFAYQMVQLGHSVFLCDKKQGPTDQSRAVLLTARSMEILENRGIAHHILKEAVILQGMQIHVEGAKVGTLDICGDTAFPQATCIGQHKTEAVLIRLLTEEQSQEIHWRTELQDYRQHEDYVEAEVRGPDNEVKVVKARYIVGADGTHSVVRKRGSDWTYEGYAVATKFALVDAVVEGPDAEKIRNQRGNFFYTPKGVLGIIPLGPEEPNGLYYHRIVANLGPYEEDKSPRAAHNESTHGFAKEIETIDMDEMHTLMRERMKPLEVTLSNPIWNAIFRINERKANGFRSKRAFLIGDSAHCHSPLGGQGLNLGLQDADNLAWKLSLVLRSLSSDPEKLLDSYTIERDSLVSSTMRATGSATRLSLGENFFTSVFSYLFLSTALSITKVKEFLVTQVMQLRVCIGSDSPLLSPDHTHHQLIKAGEFMPDSNVLRKRILTDTLERKTLHQVLGKNRGHQHTVMLVCTRPSSQVAYPWIKEFWTQCRFPSGTVRPLVVESTWHVHQCRAPEYVTAETYDDEAFWTEDHWDRVDSVSKRIGLDQYLKEDNPPAALVIVRPDLYVARSDLIRSPQDFEPALEWLHSYISHR